MFFSALVGVRVRVSPRVTLTLTLTLGIARHARGRVAPRGGRGAVRRADPLRVMCRDPSRGEGEGDV